MDALTKEEAYDAKIFPLMAQIVDLCHEHKIPMVASFTLDIDEALHCTTTILREDYEPHECLIRARNALFSKQPSCLAVTISGGHVRSGAY